MYAFVYVYAHMQVCLCKCLYVCLYVCLCVFVHVKPLMKIRSSLCHESTYDISTVAT